MLSQALIEKRRALIEAIAERLHITTAAVASRFEALATAGVETYQPTEYAEMIDYLTQLDCDQLAMGLSQTPEELLLALRPQAYGSHVEPKPTIDPPAEPAPATTG